MPRYICSLPNPGEPGEPKELFTDDDALIERFAKAESRPGRGVYECINPLVPGARRRCLENIAELSRMYFDLDLQHIEESRDEVLRKLEQLPLRFSWLRDSGNGNLHGGIEIKDPPARGTPEYDALAALWKRLAEKLAADPAPTHPAALIRMPGTPNTKDGRNGLCRTLWASGTAVDISEVQALDELLERPLLAGKPKPPKGNGHDTSGPDGGPVDVDYELANMKYGPNEHRIHTPQLRCVGALLRQGIPLDDVVAQVLAATKLAVANDVRCADWDWREEELAIARMGTDLINKDYSLAPCLPDALWERFQEIMAAGNKPKIARNAAGLHVRSYGEKVVHEAKAPEEPKGEGPRRGRFQFTRFWEMKLEADETPYLIDELIPAKGIVLLWGPPKCLKSFFVLDAFFHVAKGWEYRDRAVQQGEVCLCAFEGKHGYPKRIEALRRHYELDPATDRTPIVIMSGKTDLVRDHALLIKEIRGELIGDRPVAVILDTLNKSLVGSESKDLDMAAYIGAAEAVRDAFDCVVVVVHHCGWDESRMRGHSSLRGAVDAEISVTREGDVIVVTVEEMRDGPDGIEIVSKYRVIDVGQDKSGRPLSSLVIVPHEPDGSELQGGGKGRWPASLKSLRDAIIEALLTAGIDHQIEGGPRVKAVDLEQVRAAFYALHVVASEGGATAEQRQDSRKKAFARAVNSARSRHFIGARALKDGRQLVWLAQLENSYAT